MTDARDTAHTHVYLILNELRSLLATPPAVQVEARNVVEELIRKNGELWRGDDE